MNEPTWVETKGMTLREYFAGQVMQALVTSHEYGGEVRRIFDADNRIANSGDNAESPQSYTARIAVSMADALITELNKP